MEKLIVGSLVAISVIGLFAALSALGGLIFMAVWNFIAPVFWEKAPILSFLQAWAASVLLTFIGGAFRASTSNK